MHSQKQTADLSILISLAHHRWNIPVLAALAERSGSKFVTLANALNVSRASLSASLKDLIDLGLVCRNPGHGHPMRPEFVLTAAGQAIGENCAVLHALVRRRRAIDLAYRKWTLPLVAVIGDDALRFNELQSALSDATPRAITLGLKSMVAERWATRTIVNDYPPAAAYRLKPKGQRIFDGVARLF